ncbi:MAG: hypothetical protein ACD_46C00437G0002 [uncultured bacterium]|nr:MAG: hypothetical protein ACD_46C00437G0002 [uncultured bacterium]
MSHFLLAIDQGTTNSRAIIFNTQGEIISEHEIPLKQFFPKTGWVEQDPEEMFLNTVTCCQTAVKKIHLSPSSIAAIGITNQRETTILWDKNTGKPIYPAIVWQDRRTSDLCTDFENNGLGITIQDKTGLRLDPYFSATKIIWLLDNIPDARLKAERDELLFGTVDTYLLWKLTNGKVHATDVTNASRTMLFNIHTQKWDDFLLEKFNIPANILPPVYDNAAEFGSLDKSILGVALPIRGMAGDQQAATIGQACFHPGMIKTTFGTGCFMLLNTGSHFVQSKHHLLSTIAYRLNQQVTYGLEGSIFSAGVTVKWLRDTMQLIQTATETELLASSIQSTDGVYFVPAFTGLGAPYWDPHARGAILGLTRSSSKAEIVRAALESVCYQTTDLLKAIENDFPEPINTLRADGGMATNNWLLQFLANMLAITIQRPTCIETTALGAAYLAGLQSGIYQSLDEISKWWQMDSEFYSQIQEDERNDLYLGWKNAVKKVLSTS